MLGVMDKVPQLEGASREKQADLSHESGRSQLSLSSQSSEGQTVSKDLNAFNEQYERDWRELAEEFVFLETWKARLYGFFEKAQQLATAKDWPGLYACLSDLEPIEVAGFRWTPMDAVFFQQPITDENRKSAEVLSQRSGRKISPEEIRSSSFTMMGHVALTIISGKLKELQQQSEKLRTQLERIEVESLSGVICHKCGGVGTVLSDHRYQREEGRIAFLSRRENCSLCEGSGNLDVPVLLTPRETTANELDQKIQSLDPSAYMGIHLDL